MENSGAWEAESASWGRAVFLSDNCCCEVKAKALVFCLGEEEGSRSLWQLARANFSKPSREAEMPRIMDLVWVTGGGGTALIIGPDSDTPVGPGKAIIHSLSLCHLCFPSSAVVKNLSAVQKMQVQPPWVRKIPWRRKWQPTPVCLPGESHGQRSLVAYSSWGWKSQTRLSDWAQTYTHAVYRQERPFLFLMYISLGTWCY